MLQLIAEGVCYCGCIFKLQFASLFFPLSQPAVSRFGLPLLVYLSNSKLFLLHLGASVGKVK